MTYRGLQSWAFDSLQAATLTTATVIIIIIIIAEGFLDRLTVFLSQNKSHTAPPGILYSPFYFTGGQVRKVMEMVPLLRPATWRMGVEKTGGAVHNHHCQIKKPLFVSSGDGSPAAFALPAWHPYLVHHGGFLPVRLPFHALVTVLDAVALHVHFRGQWLTALRYNGGYLLDLEQIDLQPLLVVICLWK